MGQRSSQQDSDGITWQTTSLPLGTKGLDLRTPIDPAAMTELLNARFQDERTALQRDGHDELVVYDGGDIAPLGNAFTVTGVWMLGHGAVVTRT